jgi:hypothetical protein
MLHAAYADFLMDVFGDSEGAAVEYAAAAALVKGREHADVLVRCVLGRDVADVSFIYCCCCSRYATITTTTTTTTSTTTTTTSTTTTTTTSGIIHHHQVSYATFLCDVEQDAVASENVFKAALEVVVAAAAAVGVTIDVTMVIMIVMISSFIVMPFVSARS